MLLEREAVCIVRAIEKEQAVRIYLSDDSSKKLDKAAERRDKSPEDALDKMVTDTDEADAREGDAGAATYRRPGEPL
jgi:predicted transcriptional regulator